MARLTKKIVNKVLDNFKECHFISDALDKENVNSVDFYMFLDDNPDVAEDYQKADRYIALYLEDKVAKLSYGNDKPSNQILLAMIRARNKPRYEIKVEEEKNELENYSYEELEQMSKDLDAKLLKK